MQLEEIQYQIQQQKDFYKSGKTKNIEIRIQMLQALKLEIQKQESKIQEALRKDLNKSSTESYMAEIGMVYSEIQYMIRHIKKFSKSKRVRTPIAQFHAVSKRVPSPYGCVLVMSPWNYPFLLSMDPLVDAIAAGNTVCLKPSAYAKYTSEILEKIITNVFPSEYVSVIQGGRKENQCLLDQHFDYIFFTGSPTVGHDVMSKASRYLTPVTLELGGKSPCIVDESANISLAAKRIVFGKFLNAGQTCVAPDFVYVQASVKEQLIQALIKEVQHQYSDLEHFGKIINEKHFIRVSNLIDQSKVIYGGKVNQETQQIYPTIMKDVTWQDAVMQEEIFGPILPILTYDTLDECINILKEKPEPLALYHFSSDAQRIRQVQTELLFGGGCVNDTIIHLASSTLPFGGVGNSGMGSYHGKAGFDTFTHYKSIVDKKTWIDLPFRYAPYTQDNEKWIRRFMK